MTRKNLILLAAGGSALLLLGAFAFQHIGGLAPCKMCLWQRWPHAAAVLIGVLAIASRGPALPALGALAALATAAIGGYHTGVERGWWEGPASCTGAGNGLGGLSGTDLLSMGSPAGVVMCDEVAWQMLGLSMASWNMLASLGLVLLWILAARRN
ncbi:disulfide bond formation protein B [Pseudohalocynthiibacter aestuariivivens]|uniref:Disulfide bond formation protein B n=1 Tax=Roseovarius pelagicus TaxID=2980108 RepID=A0ABY6DG23_9RHOB|nr:MULTISPECIES: disulfide bond formation protein B [Rhodobacterales]QIE47382.1 disulfide bond formation protein B [Pseudohalocynthiibacter aestuariivivens]UXX85086.1 disulfide bond formation protein B [Roseovarius pelagicus]